MDSITQATLGAAIGEAMFGKKYGSKAAITGAIIATIPDLDVLLVPFFSPLQKISLHRGYSHSILFCIIASLILAFILSKINWSKTIRFWQLYLFNFLALFTHVLLDSFTSYGTQLYLPLSDHRVSFDSINIVDPVYTLPLLLGLILSAYLYRQSANRALPNKIGLLISSLYLLLTLVNKQYIETKITNQLEAQNIDHNELLSIPVKIGNVNWYGVAKSTDQLYIGQYHQLTNNKIEFHKFPINKHLLDELDPYLVDRMKWFAQGFYTVAESNGKIRIYNMQCDMQGVRSYGDYKAPTAFYFEITPKADGNYDLSSGMHEKDK